MSKPSERELVDLILKLLIIPKPPDEELIEQTFSDHPEFRRLYEQIMAIRELSFALGEGNIENQTTERGFVLSNMKALQANLRHLTWQTKKIAEGDYSQKVDFLGDFSDSFNMMTDTLKSATGKLMDMARLDNLTKIPNRLSLEEFFKGAFEDAKKNNDTLFVFVYDLDLFKNINDTYGHVAGDHVLIQFAQIMSNQFRPNDIFARYGGEEFVSVLPGIQLESALIIGERALRSIEKADFDIGEQTVKVTVSIGLSNIRPDDTTYEDIVGRSDAALYEAKNSGRNCLRVML